MRMTCGTHVSITVCMRRELPLLKPRLEALMTFGSGAVWGFDAALAFKPFGLWLWLGGGGLLQCVLLALCQ